MNFTENKVNLIIGRGGLCSSLRPDWKPELKFKPQLKLKPHLKSKPHLKLKYRLDLKPLLISLGLI